MATVMTFPFSKISQWATCRERGWAKRFGLHYRGAACFYDRRAVAADPHSRYAVSWRIGRHCAHGCRDKTVKR